MFPRRIEKRKKMIKKNERNKTIDNFKSAVADAHKNQHLMVVVMVRPCSVLMRYFIFFGLQKAGIFQPHGFPPAAFNTYMV